MDHSESDLAWLASEQNPCLEYLATTGSTGISKPVAIKSDLKSPDLSYSMIVDNCSPRNSFGPEWVSNRPSSRTSNPAGMALVQTNQNDQSLLTRNHLTLGSIQARQRSTWVDDKTVKNCFDCGAKFSFYLRYHHCYSCGNVFCYQCSRFRMNIPQAMDNLPIERRSIFNMSWSNNKVRVCSACAKQITVVRQLEKLIQVFDLLPLTVKDYRKMTLVCREWNHLGHYYLSKFRQIQYKLPGQAYSPLEKRMLWNHRRIMTGHNLWLSNLIRSEPTQIHLDESSIKKNFLDTKHFNSNSNLNSAKNQQLVTCRTLMCSRLCRPEMSSLELITLLEPSRQSLKLRSAVLQRLAQIPVSEMLCYLPLLVQEMTLESIETANLSKNLSPAKDQIFLPIKNFLLKQACRQANLAIEIFWECKVKLTDRHLKPETRRLYEYTSEKLLKVVDRETRTLIEDSENLIIFLNSLPRRTGDLEKIQAIFVRNQTLFEGLRIPTHPQLICRAVLIDKISLKDSASQPLYIPLRCYHQGFKKECEYYLLYKFEDVRQDQLVIKTIRLMNLILKSEMPQTELQIITYQVLPTSQNSGLIEIIPNCATLFEIEKRFTIFNYILENNRSADLSADQLRQRFLTSCAPYCVITYLLGVGDRHLDNIMVTKTGFLFHIDYGFIIGSDPKPMTQPTMRITKGMVDAIGGPQSQYYQDFIQLSQRIHHCLRRRMPVLITMLKLLVEISPAITQSNLTLDKLEQELLKRFMYGESYEAAQMQLEVQISSSSQSYNEAVIDFFHYHQREKTITNIVNGTVNWFGAFWN